MDALDWAVALNSPYANKRIEHETYGDNFGIDDRHSKVSKGYEASGKKQRVVTCNQLI